MSGISGADAIVLAVNAHKGATGTRAVAALAPRSCIFAMHRCPQPHRLLIAGKFEEGFAKGAQAREHALLAYVMGVRHVVVAVTHLDSLPVPFSKQRFEECKLEAVCYLKRLGFIPERVSCIPVSGLLGDNLVDCSTSMPWCDSASFLPFPSAVSWALVATDAGSSRGVARELDTHTFAGAYRLSAAAPCRYTGATLLETLEQLDVSQQSSDKPLRVVLFSAEQGPSRMVFKGRVVYGSLRSDMVGSALRPR